MQGTDDQAFDTFHRLGTGFRRGALHVRPIDRSIDARALLRGDLRPSSSVVLERSDGRTPYDLVSATRVGIHLISPRVQELLRQRAVTGWDTYPVEVRSEEHLAHGYSGLSITGRSGPLADERAERVVLPPRGPRGRALPGWRGLYFDKESWDGSDMFLIEGTEHIIVVAAVRAAIETSGLTNFHFTRVTEIERIML